MRRRETEHERMSHRCCLVTVGAHKIAIAQLKPTCPLSRQTSLSLGATCLAACLLALPHSLFTKTILLGAHRFREKEWKLTGTKTA